MDYRDEREQLVAFGRRTAADGLSIGTSGNMSIRVDRGVLVTPSGRGPDDTTAADICLIDLEGRQLEGELRPSSEVPMHLAVYAATDAAAVVHTHSPMATTVALTHAELPAVHYTINGLGGPVRVAPYATFGSPELAAHIAAALDGRSAAIMQSHGALTIGATLRQAYDRSLLLEWLCGLFWRASQIGSPRILTADELQAVRDQATRLRYGERS